MKHNLYQSGKTLKTKLNTFFLFLIILFSIHSQAQLGNFTFSATSTPETCGGNGTLQFSVSNTFPSAMMTFNVYRLPNLTTAVAVVSNTTIAGLIAGNYHIIATQTFPGMENGNKSYDVTIANNIVPLTYNLTEQRPVCGNDGKITVDVTSGIASTYQIVSGPITFPPQASNVFNNLQAGVYLIKVVDNCNNGIVRQHTLQATLMTISLNGQNPVCGNDGKITVSTTTGNPSIYQIISGPVTFPSQASNVFSNLPIGNYQVKASNSCGDSTTENITLTMASAGINISSVTIPVSKLDSCNSITINNNISQTSSTSVIAYPLNVQYTIFPPGGGTPIIINQIVSNGSQINNPLTETIPFYHGQPYLFDIKITDNCGNPFYKNSNIINKKFDFDLLPGTSSCGKFLGITPTIYVAPYTIDFISAPAGFNPSSFNTGHPGPFSTPDVSYGNPSTPVPIGSYTIKMTDACGRTATKTVNINDTNTPTVIVTNANCKSKIQISAPGATILTATITTAPIGYTGILPQNVSSFITSDGFIMENLPPGPYTIIITDTCTNIPRSVNAVIPPGTLTIAPLTRVDCQVGFGSVNLISASTLTNVTITAAPSTFTPPLPYNASSNIASDGSFYMNSLPAGNYTLSIKNNCNQSLNTTIIVEGYAVTSNSTIIDENCGSFDIALNYADNSISTITSYFLQKYNPLTSQWENPSTGAAYIEGTIPNAINSIILTNNATNYNYSYMGQFRVIKYLQKYKNGNTNLEVCTVTIKDFVFDGQPKIENIYSIFCTPTSSDLIIDATGAGPLKYKIIQKNGIPFQFNNGTQNIFLGLEPAAYQFQVEDICGSSVPRYYDINNSITLAITPSSLCNGKNGMLSVPNLSILSYEWRKGTDPTVLSTTNSLSFSPFNTATDIGNYHVKIIYPNVNSCINQELNYNIPLNFNLPNAGQDNSVVKCNSNQTINLFSLIGGTYDNFGTWEELTSSGTLNANLWQINNLQSGTYKFKYKVIGQCGDIDESTISINLVNAPSSPIASSNSGICQGNDLNLIASTIPNASYSWTGPNGFTSNSQNPVIPNSTPQMSGSYSVIATVDNCSSPLSNVLVAIKPAPDFSINADTVSLCENQTTTINVVPKNNFDLTNASYKWYLDGNLLDTTSQNIPVSQPGKYTVDVTLNGCPINNNEIIITRNTNAFEVLAEGNCEGNDFVINATPINNSFDPQTSTYYWVGPNNFSSTDPKVNITTLGGKIGTYTVTVTNQEGCARDANVEIPITTCMIPKGISPDGNTLNDSFDLTGFNVAHIIIYNRYGTDIYELDNYTNQWHGQTHRNNLLPSGTYFYVLTFKNGSQKTGWVYLLI